MITLSCEKFFLVLLLASATLDCQSQPDIINSCHRSSDSSLVASCIHDSLERVKRLKGFTYCEDRELSLSLLKDDKYENYCGFAVIALPKLRELRDINKVLPLLSPAAVVPESRSGVSDLIAVYILPDGDWVDYSVRKVLCYRISSIGPPDAAVSELSGSKVQRIVTPIGAPFSLIGQSASDSGVSFHYRVGDKDGFIKLSDSSSDVLHLDRFLDEQIRGWENEMLRGRKGVGSL